MIESDFDVYAAPRRARVEIIPLIDVIFFLLATFVLFTLSLQKMRDLDVPLPTTPGEVGEDFTTLFLQASENGTFFLKVGTRGVPELVTMAELGPRLESYRDSTREPRVFIRSDTRARFGDAIQALDLVRLADIKQVSIETHATAPGS